MRFSLFLSRRYLSCVFYCILCLFSCFMFLIKTRVPRFPRWRSWPQSRPCNSLPPPCHIQLPCRFVPRRASNLEMFFVRRFGCCFCTEFSSSSFKCLPNFFFTMPFWVNKIFLDECRSCDVESCVTLKLLPCSA